MADDVLFSNVQSILQLSVGTNITFAVLLSLFDTALDKHRRVANSLKLGVLGRMGDENLHPDTKKKLFPFIDLIESEINKIEDISGRMEWIVAQKYQPLFLLCALISFIALSYSVLYANTSASIWIYILALLTFIPFGWFSIKSLYLSFRISKDLRTLSNQLTSIT